MLVELDHNGLVTLVRGCIPIYDQMEHWSVKGRGHFTDNNGWFWNTEILSKLNDNELYDLYVFVSKAEAKADNPINTLPKFGNVGDMLRDTRNSSARIREVEEDLGYGAEFIRDLENSKEKVIRQPKVFKLSDINYGTEFIQGDSIVYHQFDDNYTISRMSKFLADKAREIDCDILEVKNADGSYRLGFTTID